MQWDDTMDSNRRWYKLTLFVQLINTHVVKGFMGSYPANLESFWTLKDIFYLSDMINDDKSLS